MSPYEFTKVLVAVDGGDDARKALDCALSVVKREKDEFFTRVLADAEDTARSRGVEVRTELVPGHSAEVVTHYAAARGHDLIVIAHHAHFLGDVLLGSTADRVAHHAHCPVMVVR